MEMKGTVQQEKNRGLFLLSYIRQSRSRDSNPGLPSFCGSPGHEPSEAETSDFLA